jgi:hypothetical protein
MVKTTGPLFSAEALGRIARTRPISSSMRNRVRRDADPYTAPTPPTPPTPTLTVTGVLTPDATGIYVQAGTHLGQPYYQRDDLAWFIWYTDIQNPPYHYWFLMPILGTYSLPGWQKAALEYQPPSGEYRELRYTTGTATVTE